MTLPDTIKDIAIGEDSDVHVGHQNVVKPTLFFITEESVGHPYFLGVCHCEVLNLGCKKSYEKLVTSSNSKIIFLIKVLINHVFFVVIREI